MYNLLNSFTAAGSIGSASLVVANDGTIFYAYPGASDGRGYVYAKNDQGEYYLQGTLTTPSDRTNAFGLWDIGISDDGNTVTAGNRYQDRLYVFERDTSGSWARAADIVTVGFFGDRMDISADGLLLIASDPLDDSPTRNAGEIIVLTRPNRASNTWSQIATMTQNPAGYNERLGNNIAVSSGGRLIAGSFENSRDVVIFKRTTGTDTWSEVSRLPGGAGFTAEFSDTTVALPDGNTNVIVLTVGENTTSTQTITDSEYVLTNPYVDPSDQKMTIVGYSRPDNNVKVVLTYTKSDMLWTLSDTQDIAITSGRTNLSRSAEYVVNHNDTSIDVYQLPAYNCAEYVFSICDVEDALVSVF